MFNIYWYGFELNNWIQITCGAGRERANIYRCYRDYRVLTAVGGSFDASTLAVIP
jgi:hypothetical protein